MSADIGSDGLAVVTRGVGRRAVLEVAGVIDIASAGVLERAVDDALDGGSAEVWIDLARVEFMDSSGVHVLADARARAAELNRRLRVICPAGQPRRVLDLTGLAGPLGVAATRAAAQHASR